MCCDKPKNYKNFIMHKKRHKLTNLSSELDKVNAIENCPDKISKIDEADEKLNPTEKKSLMPEIHLQSVWMLF